MLLERSTRLLPYFKYSSSSYLLITKKHWYSSLIQHNEFPYSKIHKPVMLEEVLDQLSPVSGGVYGDLTFGDGGYTKAILDSCDCKVVAIDQDPTAYEKALQLSNLQQYKGRLFPLLGRFGDVYHLTKKQLSWSVPCFDGVVMDIGVSSGQIETPSRGFSYKLDGPLDMRMFSRGKEIDVSTLPDTEQALLRKSISAYEIVNFFSREQIANIVYQYGGDRLSRKIASAIVDARQSQPIETTSALASIIQKACPQPRWKRGDDDMVRNSAARTFQALRIYINNELGELENALKASEYILKPNGNLVAVTFHSLEDRIVKNFMHHCSGKRSIEEAKQNQFDIKKSANREYKKASKKLSTPSYYRDNDDGQQHTLLYMEKKNKGRSMMDDDHHHQQQQQPSFQLLSKKVITPSHQEIQDNARSRSAKLRSAQRTSSVPLLPFGPLIDDDSDDDI
ncbi:MraW methylase family-domain-containing protein [Cunninghamella echinulata]|nr:MraW methylase family-domain-containing protein [Cunninghamella echinulata]